MTDQFVAEIRIFTCNFAPKGWAMCNGQVLPISQNTALFSLLGTTYGGDGKSNFALPNLQGAFPMNFGQGNGLSLRDLGESAGAQSVTLLSSQIPPHSHHVNVAASAGGSASPTGALLAEAHRQRFSTAAYASTSSSAVALGQTLSPVGSGFPHNNMPPFQVLNFCIALVGIYPPRS